jgi:hypothetical protein
MITSREAVMDVAAIATGMSLAKSGFEALRTALGLVKDVQAALPAGEKKETVEQTLKAADNQLRLAEAQIAEALGYALCRCEFPPTPMLAVGHREAVGRERETLRLWQQSQGRAPSPPMILIHECPKCGADDAGGRAYQKTAALRAAKRLIETNSAALVGYVSEIELNPAVLLGSTREREGH